MSGQRPDAKEQNPKIENLIIQLTHLLQNWDIESKESENTQLDDPLMILITRVNAANAADQDQCVCSIQLDVKEPEAYARTMQGPNVAEWVIVMEEELD